LPGPSLDDARVGAADEITLVLNRLSRMGEGT
jgi:hypothetical protein